MIEVMRDGNTYADLIDKVNELIEHTNGNRGPVRLPVLTTDDLPADAPVGSAAFVANSPLETPAIAVMTDLGWMYIDGGIPE